MPADISSVLWGSALVGNHILQKAWDISVNKTDPIISISLSQSPGLHGRRQTMNVMKSIVSTLENDKCYGNNTAGQWCWSRYGFRGLLGQALSKRFFPVTVIFCLIIACIMT